MPSSEAMEERLRRKLLGRGIGFVPGAEWPLGSLSVEFCEFWPLKVKTGKGTGSLVVGNDVPLGQAGECWSMVIEGIG